MAISDWKKVSQYQEANDSIGFLLWRVYFLWKRKIETALSSYGLTHIQFVLLAGLGYLTKEDNTVTQKVLAEFTHCDVTMTSQVLRGLEKKALVKRIQKKKDERAKYPELTKQGFEKLNQAMPTVENIDEQFFSILQKDKAHFLKSLQMLLKMEIRKL